MNPRYFVAVLNVKSAIQYPTGKMVLIELEVAPERLETPPHELRKAILDATDQYTAKYFSTVEGLAECEIVPADALRKEWRQSLETQIEGVRVWGVTAHDVPGMN